ncbi:MULTISPECIES: hypothetical protein [unclassified Nocardiopsis]|uniref:hypothetical protein n=1 Tax=Nocardiopsis TaxID=2013 RepID=UPI00387B1CEE
MENERTPRIETEDGVGRIVRADGSVEEAPLTEGIHSVDARDGIVTITHADGSTEVRDTPAVIQADTIGDITFP